MLLDFHLRESEAYPDSHIFFLGEYGAESANRHDFGMPRGKWGPEMPRIRSVWNIPKKVPGKVPECCVEWVLICFLPLPNPDSCQQYTEIPRREFFAATITRLESPLSRKVALSTESPSTS
jgi:hypothetical protein